MSSSQQTWQAVLGNLELSISKANFTTWFKNTNILEQSEDKVIIGVPNSFTKEWLKNKYHKNILSALKTVNPQIKKIDYQISSNFAKTGEDSPNPSPPHHSQSQKTAQEQTKNPQISQKFTSGLNPKYTFENFVVGSNNELATAAANAVSQKPGKSYNPLFIYGGVGLGKTHLMQAIGRQILQNNPNYKILYLPAERFTNEFIQAVRDNNGEFFKNTYRSVDVLLIDDIQFLAGKEQTQEEFFHTFNSLHQTNKQIVLSSDRLPKEIPSIEERLVSRFEWGMIADVQPPDYETRLAILKSKTREKNYEVDPAILEYLAQNIETNIRELEGSLNRLMVYCQLNNTPPTLEKVKSILSNIIYNPKKRGVSPKRVMEVVADFYNITTHDLIRKSRKKEYVNPRQIAMYIIRNELETSLPMIGELFGGRDHTTVIHAIDKIKNLSREKESLTRELSLITDRVYDE